MAGVLSGNQALLVLFLDLFNSGYERLTRWLTYLWHARQAFEREEKGDRPDRATVGSRAPHPTCLLVHIG